MRTSAAVAEGEAVSDIARLSWRSGAPAARARWDRVAVRAGPRMTQEGADALVELGTDDVLELAGVRVGLHIVNGEGIHEEPLGQPSPPDEIAGPLATVFGQPDMHVVQLDQTQLVHLPQQVRQLERAHRIQIRHTGRSALLATQKDLFQQMI